MAGTVCLRKRLASEYLVRKRLQNNSGASPRLLVSGLRSLALLAPELPSSSLSRVFRLPNASSAIKLLLLPRSQDWPRQASSSAQRSAAGVRLKGSDTGRPWPKRGDSRVPALLRMQNTHGMVGIEGDRLRTGRGRALPAVWVVPGMNQRPASQPRLAEFLPAGHSHQGVSRTRACCSIGQAISSASASPAPCSSHTRASTGADPPGTGLEDNRGPTGRWQSFANSCNAHAIRFQHNLPSMAPPAKLQRMHL